MNDAARTARPHLRACRLLAGLVGAVIFAPGLALGQGAEEVVIDRSAAVVVETTIAIDAPPVEVWRVLTDVARWPEWNESIASAALEGPLAVGFTIAWTTGAMDIRSRLTAVDAERGLDWEGSDGSSRGLHSWRLQPDGEGTRLTNAESIGGGIADAEPEESTRQLAQALDAWNERLKAEVEGR